MSGPDASTRDGLTVVRIELPTPDIVVVRDGAGDVVMFADARLAQAEVDAAVADLDGIMAGPAYAVCAV